MQKKLILVLLSILTLPSFAMAQTGETEQTTVAAETQANELTNQSHPAPEGCGSEGFGFLNGQLIIGTQGGLFRQQVYFVHNNSDYEQLLLSHPTNTAMSAGWLSRLDQGQWSSLIMNQPNFVINCFGRKPGVAGYVDCKSVLQVCSYSKAKASVGGGSYWLSENKPLSDTIGSIKTR